MISLRSASVALLGAASLAGPFACQQDTVKAPGSAGVDQLPADQYPKVEVTGGLSRYVVISGANVTAGTTAKPMSIVSAVRSTWDKDVLNVQYRYFFFDEKNTPLDTDPDWRFVKLPPRSQVYLEGFALDTNARDWRLQIRPAQ
ncbi:MAG: DUF1425 domain-containing protein [Planctomycetota bacterium]|nr:DUF1425 domain-containing protein [Planctomycetota bacterium]